MSRVCKKEKEFADAVKNHEDEIIVEGDLKNGVLRIHATGKVAWGVCASALAAAIVFYLATPATTIETTPVGGAVALTGGFVMSAASAAVLGSAIVPAIVVGVCAGGIGVWNTVRNEYEIIEKNDSYLKLKRKN